jgi:hypothetical protein
MYAVMYYLYHRLFYYTLFSIINASVWAIIFQMVCFYKFFKVHVYVCVYMCDIFPLHCNLFEQPLKWYYVKSIGYLVHCYIPLFHLVMSSPLCPFSGSIEQPFIAQGVSETLEPQCGTKTWMLAVKVLFFQQNSILCDKGVQITTN